MYRSNRPLSPQSSRTPKISRFRRQKTTDLYPQESSAPLLAEDEDSDIAVREETPDEEERGKAKMKFFDNLRGWDRPKIYRYLILLALSLSGDGW